MIQTVRQAWTADGCLTFESHFVSWDAEHYLYLSQKGYSAGQGACAFYPLFPLTIRWVAAATRVNDVLVGMVLSNVFSLAAFALFFQMTARRFGGKTAELAVVLLCVFPGSLFYQFIYTESLFLLLLMLFCRALQRGSKGWLAATGFFLPLTRAVGVFCVFPLVWHLFFRSPTAWRWKLVSRPGFVGGVARFIAPREGEVPVGDAKWNNLQTVFVVLAPFLGWGLYFLLMWRGTGNALEGFAAQKQFGVESVGNMFDPWGFIVKLFTPTEWHEYRGSVLDRCFFMLLVYALPLIWKLDKSWFIWSFFLGVIPAISGGFTSYTRFLSVVFPFFIALAVFLSKPERRWLRWLALSAFAVLHVLLVWRFVNYRWAG